MRALYAAILAWTLLASSIPLAAARQNPGPVTIRGIAVHVRSRDFDLRTTTRGTYHVTTLRETQVVEKGATGRLSVRENDHVGVHGFLRGRTLRAISVRIYPVAARPATYKGTILSVHGNSVILAVGLQHLTLTISMATDIATTTGQTVTHLVPGDRVSVRAQRNGSRLMALTIRVYAPKKAVARRKTHRAPRRMITIKGQVSALGYRTLTLRTGKTLTTIHLTSSTAVSGAGLPLRLGSSVSIRACCQGGSLTATAIRVFKQKSPPTVLTTGTLTAFGPTSLTVSTSRGAITARRIASTRLDGHPPVLGSRVSLRYYRGPSGPVATRLHVYPPSPARTLRGTVLTVTATGITIRVRGHMYVIHLSRGTSISLGGRPSSLASLRGGDRVTVTGRIIGRTVTASRIFAVRRPARSVTVRGTITAVSSHDLWITDASGKSVHVHLSPASTITLAGSPVPVNALFSGASARIRGTTTNGVLTATVVTVTARPRSVSGRVMRVSSASLVVASRSGGQVLVHLPPKLAARDQGKQIPAASLHVDADVSVHGYADGQSSVRAVSITVEHPTVSLSGTVLSSGSVLVLRTTMGTRIIVHIPAGTPISTGSSHVPLTPATIPAGVTVHVHGATASDGSIDATAITVHLKAWTVRAPVSSLSLSTLTLDLSSGRITVRLESGATIEQGTHPIILADIVPGDDVTAYGYVFGPNILLARKLAVHRLRVSLTGVITALASGGFILDGSTRVITGADTLMETPALAVGMTVKVSGYRRGDGSILAGSVRAAKHLITLSSAYIPRTGCYPGHGT